MATGDESEELMTCDEVCARLRISRETFYRQLREGGNVVHIIARPVGGKKFWLRSSVDAFVKGEI